MHVAINAQLVSFTDSYRNAGVSRYTYRLVEALARLDAGQHYTVFVNGSDQQAVTGFGNDRLRLVPSRWPTTQPAQRILWEQTALPELLRRVRADVFHSPVNVLPLHLPCPSVVTVHDLAFLHYPQFFRPARRLYQRTLTAHSVRVATLVIAVSQSTRRDLVDQFGADPDRVRVVYPAIEPRFQPEASDERLAAFRREQGLPERFLLYLGTLEPRKNLVGLIEAYARLRAAEPDAPPLVVAGAKGWYYDEIFAKVRAVGLERAVTFAGYVSDEAQPLWYAAAELFLYPSFFEGFGLPVAEAMACGTAVITSNVSSLPEVAGNVAIQANPHDADSLAHAMRSLLRDKETRRRLAAEGPRWACQFSAARMAEACSEIYAEAAGLATRRHMVEVG